MLSCSFQPRASFSSFSNNEKLSVFPMVDKYRHNGNRSFWTSGHVRKQVMKSLTVYTRVKIEQVDATLFVEQRLNNVVIKVQQHLLN